MARTKLTADDSPNNAMQYITAPFATTANRLLLVWVANTGGGAGVDAPMPIASRASHTLELVDTILVPGAVANRRLTCFRAASVNSIADTLTISFGSNQFACAWAVYSYDDVDLSGSNGANAIGQHATSTSLNAQAHSAALNVFADPARSTLAGALMLRLSRAVEAGSGLAEIDERQMPGNLGTLETA